MLKSIAQGILSIVKKSPDALFSMHFLMIDALIKQQQAG
jgi:hypothetical protein